MRKGNTNDKNIYPDKRVCEEMGGYGRTDDDLRRLEYAIMKNPKIGPVIPGTGRLRKMRFPYENRGKSGSARVCYVDYLIYDTVYLITAYAKNEKDSLSKSECNAIRKLIDVLEYELEEVNL